MKRTMIVMKSITAANYQSTLISHLLSYQSRIPPWCLHR